MTLAFRFATKDTNYARKKNVLLQLRVLHCPNSHTGSKSARAQQVRHFMDDEPDEDDRENSLRRSESLKDLPKIETSYT